jgi:hypothetical protein
MRFEVFTVVRIQVIFWVVMPHSIVVEYQHFEGPYCLHLQGEANSSEILVSLHNITQHCNPEDLDLRLESMTM